jgi:RHS repeat-associated protein
MMLFVSSVAQTIALHRLADSHSYDDAGKLITATNPLEEETTFAYNGVGWVTSVTNARNYTRTYAYMDRGEVSSLTLPDNSVEQWTYNANGQVTAYTNPLSQVIAYVYDDAGRLTAIDYPTGTDVAFSYDDSGRLVSMSDSTGATSWTYDAVSQLTLLETPQAEISYSYNDAGQLVSMNHDGVGVTEYEYDDDGRLVSLTNPFEETTSFVYDDASRLTRKNLANGVYELYTYDNRSRLIGIQIKNSAHQLIDSHSYDYDAVSNIVERTSGGVTTEFGYDLVGQLISETRSGYSASYTYDANGNRLTRTVNNVTEEYAYDGADKLLEVTINSQTVKEFTYDAAGRTTSVTTSAGTTTLSWDYEDRLIGITYPSTATNSFSYNAFGARVSKTDSSGTSTYARNGVSVVAPVLSDGSLTFTPGISSNDGSSSRFSHGDIKNSLRQTTANETTTATKHYDAFGNPESSTGTWEGSIGYGGPFGYQSDADSGLMLVGSRYYDASTGRFLSRDGTKYGKNWYAYCRNNPVSFYDYAGAYARPIGPQDQAPPPPIGSGGTIGDDPGRRAAEQALEIIRRGDGPKDCGWFVGDAYAGIASTPARERQANQWDAWFRARPNEWQEIANDGQTPLKPGDIIVITKPNKKHGHIMMVGLEDEDGDLTIYDASLNKRRPGVKGKLPKGRKLSDPDGTVTIWRRKPRSSEKDPGTIRIPVRI